MSKSRVNKQFYRVFNKIAIANWELEISHQK